MLSSLLNAATGSYVRASYWLHRKLASKSGQGMMEYIAIALIVGIAVIIALPQLRTSILSKLSAVVNGVNGMSSGN